MFASGTSDGDHQPIFSLFDIIRDQELNHIGQLVQENSGLRKTHYIVLYSLIIAGLRLQFFYIIRVGQKSHIKYQISVRRNSVLESEGHDCYHETVVLFILYENSIQLLFQFSYQKIRSIYYIIGIFADRLQNLTFFVNAVLYSAIRSKRMYTSGFLIPFYQS